MISPGLGSSYGDAIAEFYRDAELRILARIAASLQQGIEAPDWETLQLARVQYVRAAVLEELSAAYPVAAAKLRRSLREAYGIGELSAFADVGGTLDPVAAPSGAQVLAVEALATDATLSLASVQAPILRAVDDIYRQVVADAAAAVVTGSETRVAAAQRALNTLLGKGLTVFTGDSGRRMGLSDYVAMAVRTATSRAAIQGHENTMDAMGLDLVIIHPGPRACDICDRWARKILARKGPTGRLVLENLRGGPPVIVIVDATLAEARAAGWGHPNDRCNLEAYMPGVSNPDDIERPPWDEDAYKAQQQQRAIERQIRAWKTRQQLALTDDERAKAGAQVASWQKAMRDHLAAHPDLKRQGKREQI